MLGYFGYNGYDDDWEDDPYWSIIGYPGAVAGGQRPSFQGASSPLTRPEIHTAVSKSKRGLISLPEIPVAHVRMVGR